MGPTRPGVSHSNLPSPESRKDLVKDASVQHLSSLCSWRSKSQTFSNLMLGCLNSALNSLHQVIWAHTKLLLHSHFFLLPHHQLPVMRHHGSVPFRPSDYKNYIYLNRRTATAFSKAWHSEVSEQGLLKLVGCNSEYWCSSKLGTEASRSSSLCLTNAKNTFIFWCALHWISLNHFLK